MFTTNAPNSPTGTPLSRRDVPCGPPKEAVLVRIPDSQPLPMGRRVNRPSFVGGVAWRGGAHLSTAREGGGAG